MINLRISLTNPWRDRFESIYSKTGNTPIKHKFWEVQAMKTNDIFVFDLRFTTRQSHAGIDLWLGLIGYSINLQCYDSRHWNDEENRWYDYGENNS